MTISKKTLDEAIETYRDYRANEYPTELFEKHWNELKKLTYQINYSVQDTELHFIISAFVNNYKTNETIYKAIELLGINII